MDTLLDKNGNEIYNATGYPIRLKENGKFSLSGLKVGDVIHVNTDMGSERMQVVDINGNIISCDKDGVEATVILYLNHDVFIFKETD
jgi:hypothetical protein